jgi:hypothetical protein
MCKFGQYINKLLFGLKLIDRLNDASFLYTFEQCRKYTFNSKVVQTLNPAEFGQLLHGFLTNRLEFI